MKLLILSVLVLSAACAPIEVRPIEIGDTKVVLSIDPKMLDYFRASCIAEHPTYNGAQVEQCAQAKAGDFLSGFNQLGESK